MMLKNTVKILRKTLEEQKSKDTGEVKRNEFSSIREITKDIVIKK